MIANKLMEIEEIEAKACSITVATDKENIKSSGNKDKIGSFAVLAADISKEVDDLKAKRQRIIKQIDNMDNEQEYDILTLSFVLMMNNTAIAEKRNYGVDNIKRIKRNALKNFEIMYGESYLTAK